MEPAQPAANISLPRLSLGNLRWPGRDEGLCDAGKCGPVPSPVSLPAGLSVAVFTLSVVPARAWTTVAPVRECVRQWAGLSGALVSRWPAALLAHPLLFAMAVALSVVLMGSPFAHLYQGPKSYLSLLIALAALLLVLSCWRRRGDFAALRDLSAGTVVCWSVLFSALVLRYFLNEFLPLSENLYEEWGRAAEAYAVMQGEKFPVDHRFLYLLSAGALQFAEGNIDALRVPVRMLGTMSVLAMGFALWRSGARWPAVFFGVFVMATLRWLVLSGAVADERASEVFQQTVLILCVVGTVTSRSGNLLWAAWGGFFGGMLLYGYAGFLGFLAACFMVPVVAGLWSGSPEFRRKMVVSTAVFLLMLVAVGAPALSLVMDTSVHGHSHYDWMYRHGSEHGLNARLLYQEGVGPYLASQASDLWRYAGVLYGLQPGLGSPEMLLYPDRLVVPTVMGLLFLLGTVHALFRPMAGGLNRSLSVFLLVCLLILAVVPGNLDHSRLSPMVAFLPFLSALMLDDALGLLARRRSSLMWAGRAAVLLLTAALVALNVSAVFRQYNAVDTLNTYAQRHESVCRLIGTHPGKFDNYYVFHGDCNRTHSRWVFNGRRFGDDVRNRLSLQDALPDAVPGTLYLLAHDRDLPPSQVDSFVGLAQELGSASSLRTYHDSDGRMTGMAFCYQCK